MAGDVKRRAHEVIYRALGCCIETMDLPATYKAAVTVRIMMDLEAAGIGVHWEDTAPPSDKAQKKINDFNKSEVPEVIPFPTSTPHGPYARIYARSRRHNGDYLHVPPTH